MQINYWQKARFFVLVLLVLLITLSSHPTIVDISRAAGFESGTILSRYIILLFVVLFLMCFNLTSMFKLRIVRTCWVWYLFIVLFYMVTYGVFGTNAMMSDVRSIAICIVAIMIGWQLNLGEKELHRVLLIYSVMTLFVGIMQVVSNIGGFQILNQYETDNKNALGVMLSNAVVIFVVMGFNLPLKKIGKILLIVLAVLSFVVLLTIRARSATLAAMILFCYIFYKRYKGHNLVLYTVLTLLLFLGVYLVFPSTYDYIYNSFFQNFENGGDVSSGRIERNAIAWRFLTNHIILGNLNQNVQLETVHNYLLNRVFEFGVLFVFPIMVLYIYLWIRAMAETIKSNSRINQHLGYYLLLIPFIISLTEYTFPYGPGTATVFNFILFGVALRFSFEDKAGNEVQLQV